MTRPDGSFADVTAPLAAALEALDAHALRIRTLARREPFGSGHMDALLTIERLRPDVARIARDVMRLTQRYTLPPEEPAARLSPRDAPARYRGR